MNKKREQDEHLERLWYMREEDKDTIDILKDSMADNYNNEVVDELLSRDLVKLLDENRRIVLTNSGQAHARQLIRAHRLAERLLYNVLGGEFESGACEFEHTVTEELVDSICTLLGHPKECPHGMPIPEGECCRRSSKTAHCSIVPLRELHIGESARVAYVNCRNDQQLHKIDSLLIRPGTTIKLHQKYPSYVIECQETHIAIDDEIASRICIWRGASCSTAGQDEVLKPTVNGGGGWRKGLVFRRRR
jgi:DtxR family Mn-dependent transcriptional regulator